MTALSRVLRLSARVLIVLAAASFACSAVFAEQPYAGDKTDDRREATEKERLELLRGFLVTRDESTVPDPGTVDVFLSDALVVRGLDRSLNDMLTTEDPGPVPYYCPSFSSSCFCNGIIDCIDLQLSGRCANGGILEPHGGGWDKCPQGPGASDGCDTWGKCP